MKKSFYGFCLLLASVVTMFSSTLRASEVTDLSSYVPYSQEYVMADVVTVVESGIDFAQTQYTFLNYHAVISEGYCFGTGNPKKYGGKVNAFNSTVSFLFKRPENADKYFRYWDKNFAYLNFVKPGRNKSEYHPKLC